MNRKTGKTLTDLDHISQSIRDILMTPEGTSLMRREYGSLLSALIDQPQKESLRLQIMSAHYLALLRWEPRVKFTAINFEPEFDGTMLFELTGNRTDTLQPFSLAVPVS